MILNSLLKSTILILGLLLIFLACGDEDSPTEPNETIPAQISVEPDSLDFGPDVSQLMLFVTNTGGGTLTWECDSSTDYASLSRTSGSLTTGTDTIEVTVNREGIPLGTYYDTLIFTSNGGSDTVTGSVTCGSLEPITSLLGEYEGFYVHVDAYGSANDTSTWDVIFRFSDQNYWLFDNTSAPDECICEPSGTYSLGAGSVELEQIVEGCAGCVFDAEKLPWGAFELRQPTNPDTELDSLVMTQITGDIKKEILLAPMSD